MRTSKTLVGAAICAALTWTGCGAGATGATTFPPATGGRATAATPRALPTAFDTPEGMLAATTPEAPEADLSGLPIAPWSSERVPLAAAPDAFVRAWRAADNRTWCAPVTPASIAVGRGTRARPSAIEGGWMVEFDRNGARGVRADGRTCARCGRAAFGIVGTSMTPDMATPEEATPTYADGSRAQIEPPASTSEAAAATLTIAGQGCVYQVWSFLGEQHVRELVSALRLVETGDGRATLATVELPDAM